MIAIALSGPPDLQVCLASELSGSPLTPQRDDVYSRNGCRTYLGASADDGSAALAIAGERGISRTSFGYSQWPLRTANLMSIKCFASLTV